MVTVSKKYKAATTQGRTETGGIRVSRCGMSVNKKPEATKIKH